jgi:hypothetical protein
VTEPIPVEIHPFPRLAETGPGFEKIGARLSGISEKRRERKRRFVISKYGREVFQEKTDVRGIRGNILAGNLTVVGKAKETR